MVRMKRTPTRAEIREAAKRRKLSNIKSPQLEDRYEIEKRIGGGFEGQVYKARRYIDGKNFTCKTVPVNFCPWDEVLFLRKLASEGTIKLEEVIQDCEKGNWHIILELCACSLHDRIQQYGPLSEREAADLIQSVGSTLQMMHERDVVHRDLKPGNILLTSHVLPYHVKVADFGLASIVSDTNLHDEAGTRNYMAPEIWRGWYSKEVDIWSLGLLLYECLSGEIPLHHLTKDDIRNKLGSWSDILPSELDWSNISSEAKEFILDMANMDMEKRLTAAQVLTHPWILHHTKKDPVIN